MATSILSKEKVFGGNLEPGPVAIGIDQSLTGFALTALNVTAPDQYQTWVYKSDKRGVARLADIRWWLMNKFDHIAEGGDIQEVAMEGTVLASQSALVLGELAATVKLACWDYFDSNVNRYVPYPDLMRVPLQIPPMTLKKYAAGKGNAKKQEMLMQIFKRWGIEFNDDNAADSYALARLASGSAQGAIEEAIVEQIKDSKYRDSTD
jgi:Holliday junction resolvasome RuvABC endonuclease subunit